MNENFNQICNLLLKEVENKFEKEPLTIDIEFSDNLAEMLEKLVILHIRLWKLEDEVALNKHDPASVAEIKHKIDFICRIKRPKLLKAVNSLLDVYVTQNRPFTEEDIKHYRGYHA